MTLEEIDNLSVEDVEQVLLYRLWNRMDPRPENEPNFYQPELEAELALYKSRLIEAENEKTRKEDIKNRFKNLKDMRQSFHSIHDQPNPELWLKNLLFASKEHAEAKIKELEDKDLEIQNDPVKKQKEFNQARLDEYNKEGLTYAAVIEALWEKVMENKPEKADAMIPIREKVKAKVPKI